MATAELRERDRIALDLIGLAGLGATAFGLVLLAHSKAIGFDAGGALEGVLGELSTTLPAAAIVTFVAAIELVTGLAIARLAHRRPFDSIADSLLAAAVALVLKDVVELSILGQVGLFRAPVLALLDVAVLAGAWQLRQRVGRWFEPSVRWRPDVGDAPRLLAVLVLVIWAGPILVQLASPVVPFIDVLPNHVAPAEHLRTFGVFTPLTVTQSPIYGPSRSLLGYVAVLGTVTTLSGLPATLALAAFVLPSTVLIGVAAYRLVVVAGGGGPSWTTAAFALLAFALTGSFARLADDRATVIVLPLAAFALAFAVDRTRSGVARGIGDPAAAWRLPDGVVLGLALGASILVHPVIGALAAATVGLVALVLPARTGSLAVTAAATAAIVAAPQAATMVGLSLPAVALVLAIAAGIVAGIAVDRARAVHGPLLLAARVAAVAAVAVGAVLAAPDAGDLSGAPGPFLLATALLLIAWAVGAVAGAPAARDPVLLAAAAVGFVSAVATQAVPATGLLGQAVRFELPKTLYYWIPVVAAVPAAVTLDWLRRTDRVDRIGAAVLTGVWLVVAAVPLRPGPIDAFHLGEHRFSEALAIDLRVAASGFWVGYPDSREIVDPGRRALLDAVGLEIGAGRIGPDTPILHVAKSFQQWVATPLGVFAGVTETDVSPDAEHSIHTVGGRLFDLGSLPSMLASKAYPYLLLEPDGLDPEVGQAIAAAGYASVYANDQGTLFHLGGS